MLKLKTNEIMGACVARRRAWGRGALAVALAGSLALAGCTGGTFEEAAEGAGEKTGQGQSGQAQGDNGATGATDAVDWASLIDIPGMDFAYSDRDRDASYDEAAATKIALTGQGAMVSGEGAAVEGSTVIITAAGTYVVSGELTAGSLTVNAGDADKVQIVLSGASIRNEAGPALNIQQADKVFVTLAAGSQNTLADGASYTLAEGEDEPNAALYSKADLAINGTGALTVEGNYRHGVNSKDDLVVTGGAITVTAKEDGLRGKDCVKIADGTFAVTAGEDGIQSSNDEDPTRGFVAIDGGTFAIKAGDEGVQAATYLRIAGGKGQVEAADHALRSEVEAAMTGGAFTVEAGGKGMNPETRFTMDGGTLNVTGSDEGIEAEEVIVNDGELNIVASDDGINAAVAERSDETAEAAVAANASEDCLIQINGGMVTVDAGGDGLDSNGYVEVNGGVVLASGSAGGGDSALDYEYGAKITGGAVILAGATGMAETFTEGTQPFAMVAAEGAAGTNLVVTDEAGTVLVSYTVPKAFQCAAVSAPGLTEGATGKVIVGGTVTGADSAGYATGAAVEGGTTVDFTASTTPSNEVGRMGGGDGGRRGGGPRGGGARDAQGNATEGEGATAGEQNGTAPQQGPNTGADQQGTSGQGQQSASAQTPQPEVVA
ncbi:carbohydrate-binding domain-containing protein [uncultured Adlercreutzia sp.]|uniref:carbohydrate-binding domain-containing protein n=1 Tax=uncultured Adlercreutzia sp. TaxID=875803 RepID=UPI00258E9C88|nr:carbohydrate-binding domain-containing protein [uncultured Adlercreutzia sp.]